MNIFEDIGKGDLDAVKKYLVSCGNANIRIKHTRSINRD